MRIEFDPANNKKNQMERGLSFDLAGELEWETALIRLDIRKRHSQPRFNALGLIGERLYHLTFMVRVETIQVIGLRRANRLEVIYYAHHQ